MQFDSGTEAGYNWASQHKCTQDDVDSYSGSSESFQAGMQKYIDEQKALEAQKAQASLKSNV